ncbi:MAG: glycine betaine ABC transporter substrate-binding protein [Intrasporangium sp.]|uniref:glycine betaine ABC transporter substrate-binding protein n=1 Tax=Intrasporangium sp. TaxID=1925024 RepID=UPI003F7F4DCF
MMRTTRLARTVTAGSAAILAVGLVAACGKSQQVGSTSGDAGSGKSSAKTLTIPIAAGWDEDKVVSHLWKHVLEQKGYTVKVPDMDIGVIFTGISKGKNSNIDVFFDTWLPTTHQKYWEKVGKQVEDLGTWYDQATLNLAVPTYMEDVNSIADLKGKANELDGTITGIDPGAGLTDVTKNKAMPAYGLDDFKLQTSSTAAMLAALKKATDAKKPIVVTLWHPHWAYSAYPLKDLKDPEGAMGGAEEIHTIARQGFSEDFPEVAKAMSNFKLADDKLADLEKVVLQDHKEDPEAGIEAWAKDNKDVVDAMMP